MAYDIGPKIGIEGEKQFRETIQSINTSMKTLGTEMGVVASQFGKGEKSVDALSSKNDVLTKQIELQRNKLEQLSKGLSMASEKYGDNDKVTQGWQQTVNKATAELNGMERELQQNEKALSDAKRGYNDAGQQLDEFGNVVEKTEKKTGMFSGALKASAVAIGGIAVAATAAAIQMGREVVKQFGELEQNLGGSEAVFGAYAASIQKTGEEAYKNLGVSQSEYLATANKMGALFQGSGVQQQKSLELTEKAMQRAADMASVMGIDMKVALDSVAGAAKGNFTMMDNLGVAMNATNIEAYALSKGLNFTWKTATQAEKAEVAMQMFFESTEQYAGNFARESTQTISGSIGLLKAAVGSFTAGLGNANADMQNLTENVVDAFGSVVKNVVPIIENLTNALPKAFAAMIPALGALLPSLLNTATGLFKQVLDTIFSILPQLIPVAVAALMTFTDTLIANLPLLIDGALQLILALSNGIVTALPELIPAMVETMITIVESLIDNIDKLVEASIAIIVALASGLINALPRLLEKAPEIVQKLVDAIVRNAPKLLQAAISIIQMLVNGIVENLSNLGAVAADMVNTIIAGIMDLLPKVIETGVNIVKGLWEGIKSMASWLARQVSGFFEGIIDGAKEALGIHSPSRVFAGIGENMAAGLGVGFSEQMRAVSRQINDAIPIPEGDYAFAAAGVGGRGITIQQTNHFNGSYKPRDGAAAVRNLNRQLGKLYR